MLVERGGKIGHALLSLRFSHRGAQRDDVKSAFLGLRSFPTKEVLAAATFVLVFNRVNIVAVNAILVLHVGKTGRRTVGRTPLGLHVS